MESLGILKSNSSLTASILSVKFSAIAGDFLTYFVLNSGALGLISAYELVWGINFAFTSFLTIRFGN